MSRQNAHTILLLAGIRTRLCLSSMCDPLRFSKAGCVCRTLRLRSVRTWALLRAGAAVVRGQAAADKRDRGRGRCSEQGAARKVHAHGAASEAGQPSMHGGASRTGQRSVQGRAAFTAPCTTL